MKTVWLLNHYALEPSGSGGTRHFSLARHAQRHGLRIIIIAASVEYLSGRQRLGANEHHRIEQHEGVTFLWVRTTPYVGNGPGRIRNMLEYSFRVLQRATTHDLPPPDLLIGSSVHPLAVLAARQLAKRFAVPFVFEVRDLWPETLIQMGRITRTSPSARMLRMLEKYLYRKAAKIITLLPLAHEYIAPIGIPEEKITWISNGVDLDGFAYRPPAQLSTLTFMYTGAHGEANGLEMIIRAVGQVNKADKARPIQFRFIGNGPIKPKLIELSKQLGVSDIITFEPPVTKHQIPQLVTEADAFIVNLRDLPLYRYGISLNKLFDYLAAGRPIVFAGSPANNPVRDAQAGVTVAADDAEAMAQAILRVAAMPFEERVAMGKRGRSYVEAEFSYAALAQRLCNELLPLMR